MISNKLIEYARTELKKGLALCTEPEQFKFKRMYSHEDLTMPINQIVDNMPDDKLDWALCQVDITLKKKNKQIDGHDQNCSGKFIGADRCLYTKIESSADIAACRNEMAKGNYPLSMTDCEVVGINGDCGLECPVWMRGDCKTSSEMLPRVLSCNNKDNILEWLNMYPDMINELLYWVQHLQVVNPLFTKWDADFFKTKYEGFTDEQKQAFVYLYQVGKDLIKETKRTNGE